MINDQLEKALNTLETFNKLARETTSKGGMKNLEYIDQQIQACKNAIQFKENPVAFSKKSMGSDFSQGSINDNPAVSFDGNTIVYTERRGIVNAIFYSKKERGKWQTPIEITADLMQVKIVHPVHLIVMALNCFSIKPIIMTELYIHQNLSMVPGLQ